VYFFACTLLGVSCFVGLHTFVGDGTSSMNGELGISRGLWGRMFSVSSWIEKVFLSTVVGVFRFALVIDSGDRTCDMVVFSSTTETKFLFDVVGAMENSGGKLRK